MIVCHLNPVLRTHPNKALIDVRGKTAPVKYLILELASIMERDCGRKRVLCERTDNFSAKKIMMTHNYQNERC